MHLTTAQSNLQQLKRRLVPRLRLETHCSRDSAATRPRALVPRLRLGTHCTRGSAATQSTQLRRQAVNHPTSNTTTPATTYTTLRLTTPQRTTTAPTTKQPTQNTNAPTTTPPTTFPNLASAETTLSTPQIKQKPWQPARVLYITLLRLLVATIGYIHRLRQRPPSYHGRSTSTASHRNHAYNTPSTAPSHRNHPLRSTPKTKTYNYDGNKYNYDDIAPSYDVLHNLRRRPYEAKEQSSPTCLNDMSQYRAYFVPTSTDPLGLSERKYKPKLRQDLSSWTQLSRFGNQDDELILVGGKDNSGSGSLYAWPWHWKSTVNVVATDTSVAVRPRSKYRWYTRGFGGHGKKWDYLTSSLVKGKVWCKCVDGKPKAFASVTPSDAQSDNVVSTNASLAKSSEDDGSITIQFVGGGAYAFDGDGSVGVSVKGVSLAFPSTDDSFHASGSLVYECEQSFEAFEALTAEAE